MSWLLVAFIPGLLMLATFGLERLESSLCRDTVTAADVADFLERAAPVKPAAAVEARPEPIATPLIGFDDEPGLPTRIYRPSGANPQFQETRHANRV